MAKCGKYKDPEYMKKYREANREEILELQQKWREKHKEHSHNYYENHKEHIKNSQKERIRNEKFSVMAIYSEGQPKCVCCGETQIDFLTIDHVNNDGAKHRRKIFGEKAKFSGGHAFYRWIIRNNFPDNLQVLCGNCQLGKKLNDGICPHQINQ